MNRLLRFAPDVTAGGVSALVTLSYSVSYAVLIFSNPALGPFLAWGFRAALITAAVAALVVTLQSSFPFAIAGPDSNATAVLAVMSAGLTQTLVTAGLPGERVAGAVVLMLVLSAVGAGLLVSLLGLLHWGRLVRLIPYPVCGGFLAGSGFLLLAGAFKVLTGQSLDWGTILLVASQPALAWGTAFAVAVVLLVVPRIVRHFLVLPSVFVGAIVLFYVGFWLSGLTVEAARAQGLLMTPIEDASNVWWPSLATPWPALLEQWRNFVAMAVVMVVSILLNAAGLELATQREVDLDRELRASGLGSLVSGLGGGMVGYLSVSRSLLNLRAGAVSRAAGLWTAMFCAVVALFFTRPLFFFPRPVLAGLLIFLGLSLLREWLWEAFFRLPVREYALIVAIFVLTAVQGIITGVTFGLVVASLFFAYSYSRANYVRHDLSVATHRSNKERTLEAMATLQARGHRGRALCLQGYLFFALVSSLVDTCRNLILRDGVRYLLLDFRMVQGLDASAALGLSKLHQLCLRHRITLILSGLRPEHQAVLEQMRFLPRRDIRVVSDLDRGVEWVEDCLLANGQGLETTGPSTQDGAEQAGDQPLSADLRDMLAAHFSAEALSVILDLCERIELPQEAVLIRRGEAGDALYFVERGEVSVMVPLAGGERKRMRTLGPGSLVGEMALYSGQLRSADVVAETPCRVRRLSAERFARLERENPAVVIQFHSFVVKLLTQRLGSATEEIRALL
ncbi:MAG TPA: SulP family inorganic anion transporter [Candidatus Bathyarchaeia archaeon]|nr:SulP family inorganic anion transporter [Candidatus Bathyarchaeia archaeon]